MWPSNHCSKRAAVMRTSLVTSKVPAPKSHAGTRNPSFTLHAASMLYRRPWKGLNTVGLTPRGDQPLRRRQSRWSYAQTRRMRGGGGGGGARVCVPGSGGGDGGSRALGVRVGMWTRVRWGCACTGRGGRALCVSSIHSHWQGRTPPSSWARTASRNHRRSKADRWTARYLRRVSE